MRLMVLATIGLAPLAAQQRLALDENWRLQSSSQMRAQGAALSLPGYPTEGWYPTRAPATVLAALVENNVYPDPYYGLNLKAIPGFKEGRWLVMPAGSPFRSSWWYRTEFELPGQWRGKYLRLHLDGINYQANVWLNGRKIADQKDVIGMFRRFEFSMEQAARIGGRNCLAVEIIPPGLLPERTYGTKQIQATTGWDDHNPQPPDMNMGLWQPVYVTASGPVILRHPYVASKLALPSTASAELKVTVEATNLSARPVAGELSGEIENLRFAQPVRLAPGESVQVSFAPERFPQLRLSRPRLWWPHPVGPQELYRLRLWFVTGGEVSDALQTRFGIRDAATYLNSEGWRQYTINGRKILIRGGAWMTSDMLLRLTRRRYEALIRYAREARLNMLRSEGFSIRETDEFYDLCDEYGVMVTQQLFGRSIPDEALAVACVKDTILRIRNHPSLVHFLGHDETYPTPSLDKAYRELIAQYTPERTYQPHSGAFDVKERFQTGGTRTGTRQLWTYATPSHYYRNKEAGAWGFAQSGGIGGTVAPLESMRRMMPEKDLWPPWTPAWSFHTVIQGGRYFDALLKALDARYGKARDIQDFTMKAQALNYESARGMYEAYARNKYSATGITAWKYNAAWPASPTWQYVDWYLMAGGAYYGAKKACEPLHVQYSYDDHSVWVVNSYYREFRGLRVTARLYDLDLRERWSQSAAAEVGPDGRTPVFTVRPPADISKTFFLSLKLTDAAGRTVSDNFYWLSSVPEIPGSQGSRDGVFYIDSKSHPDYTALAGLRAPRLRLTSRFQSEGEETLGRVSVENPGPGLAFLVQLAVTRGQEGDEVTPCYWEDNYFSLLPGENRALEVRFPTAELAGAAPAVRAAAWPEIGRRGGR
jgi:exo-1,4-beta-D-glucosaminidase